MDYTVYAGLDGEQVITHHKSLTDAMSHVEDNCGSYQWNHIEVMDENETTYIIDPKTVCIKPSFQDRYMYMWLALNTIELALSGEKFVVLRNDEEQIEHILSLIKEMKHV